MKHFAALIERLDQTRNTNRKVLMLAAYFETVADEEKVWVINLLCGHHPKRIAGTAILKSWAVESSGLPLWLFEESNKIVGDVSETIALFSPASSPTTSITLVDSINLLIALKERSEEDRKIHIIEAWKSMTSSEKFVFNKLATGGFRPRVSKKVLVRALAHHTGLDDRMIMYKITCLWDPQTTSFSELILFNTDDSVHSRPYPLCQAKIYSGEPEDLGEISDWQVERKWPGIRCQLVFRNGALFIWSEDEELITDKFPEFGPFMDRLSVGTVIEGHIIGNCDERAFPLHELQKRLDRKKVTKKFMNDFPVVLIANDIMEYKGEHVGDLPLTERRKLLETEIGKAGHAKLQLSEVLPINTWESMVAERIALRKLRSDGLILRSMNGKYAPDDDGWLLWKTIPLTVNSVLIYAEQDPSGRSMLFSKYTLAVWKDDELVPIAKTGEGLSDDEINAIDLFVRDNTLERFGPVRRITPEFVFQLEFENIASSRRRKSGLILDSPKIRQWKKDMNPSNADTLNDLKEFLEKYG